MRRALSVLVALAASGCYASHGITPAEADAGPSIYEGRWLLDQPEHALYEAVVYDLEPGGAMRERCRFEAGPPPDSVTRESDGLTCHFTGPWSSRVPEELAILSYCDDSVERMVVLEVALPEVRVIKVGGEEGWSHGPFTWRWLRCADDPEACERACE